MCVRSPRKADGVELARRKTDDLEELAHLVLGDQAVSHGAVGQAGGGHPGVEPAVQQEVRLAGVAQHGLASVLRRERDAGEVDVGRDVLETHGHQRVGVGAVALVAHQRAANA